MLTEEANEAIHNQTKEQKGGFPKMLLGKLGASLLGNILARNGINRAEEGIGRAGYWNKRGQKTTTKRQDYEKKMDF